MMLFRTADQAFALYQRTGDPRALARVFDKTAGELLKLARHLACNEAAAEDLLQATFVTAIEAARTHRDGEPVVPWLVGILGNHARAARRKGRRALDARAVRDDTSDPTRDAEQRELQGCVHDAIAGLPELYRPVLRLYLEQGLEPAEIARALDRPQGTVRAQVHRGLDALRSALPAALGTGVVLAASQARGLAAVRHAVVAQCGKQVGGAVAATSLGVLTMMNWKVLASAAAVAAVAFSAWTVLGGDAGHAPDTTSRAPASLGAGASPAATDAARVPVVETTPTAHGAVETSPSLAPKTTLRVLVRHSGKPTQPPAGIPVRVQPLAQLQDPESASDPVLTDADGVALFADVAPGDTWACLDHADVRVFVAIEAGKDHEVKLMIPPGISVEGTVRDAAGQPVGQALVLAHTTRMEPDVVTTTDARGHYRVDGLAANVSLQARARGHAPSLGRRVQGKAGAKVTLDLALQGRGRRIVGRVWQPDGTIAARTRVAIAPANYAPATPDAPFAFALFARTDGAGRFLVDEASTDALVVVGVPPRGSSAAPAVVAVAAGSADVAVDVRLRRGATIHGVVTENGRTRSGVSVTAWAEKPSEPMGYLLNLLGMRAAVADRNGAYRIGGLVPGSYRLSATRQQILASHTLEIAEGADYEWSPCCGVGPALTVAITPATPPSGSRSPVWMPRLYRRAADGNLEFVNFAVADAKGRVQFAGANAGDSYDVVVSASVGAGAFNDVIVAHLRDVRPQGAPHKLTIDAASLPSARVRGRLVDAQGAPRPNRVVLARAHVSDILLSHANVITDRDGRFDLGPLPPGAWTLLLGTEPAAAVLGQHDLAQRQTLDLGDLIER